MREWEEEGCLLDFGSSKCMNGVTFNLGGEKLEKGEVEPSRSGHQAVLFTTVECIAEGREGGVNCIKSSEPRWD